MAGLKREIAQERPFSSPHEEALLNIFRTADCLQRAFQRRARQWEITGTQYNVLRILRGAHPQGLTCSAIGDRMITAVPDITRLLARLKALKLIRQRRDPRDRRVVWTRISDSGLDLLRQMDPVIQALPGELLDQFTPDEVTAFISFLERARAHCADAAQPLACELQASEPASK
ncbi:MAG: MarR family transcriptional regulator [Terracidiphilus sp.]